MYLYCIFTVFEFWLHIYLLCVCISSAFAPTVKLGDGGLAFSRFIQHHIHYEDLLATQHQNLSKLLQGFSISWISATSTSWSAKPQLKFGGRHLNWTSFCPSFSAYLYFYLSLFVFLSQLFSISISSFLYFYLSLFVFYLSLLVFLSQLICISISAY